MTAVGTFQSMVLGTTWKMTLRSSAAHYRPCLMNQAQQQPQLGSCAQLTFHALQQGPHAPQRQVRTLSIGCFSSCLFGPIHGFAEEQQVEAMSGVSGLTPLLLKPIIMLLCCAHLVLS
jgi:hypothetical protein